MNTKYFILATALFSTITILGCDEGVDEPELALDTVEGFEAAVDATSVSPENDVDDAMENAIPGVPFAEVEISDGHRLRFFTLPDGSVISEESAQYSDFQPVLRRELSPLEVYWRWTPESQEIPSELLANYEMYVGDLDEFFKSAVPRGSDRMSADEIAAPPTPPQESKWWASGCPAPTDYNYINCQEAVVPVIGSHTHFMRIAGPFLYTVLRDTVDTDRDVKLYFRSTVGGTCTWLPYYVYQIPDGMFGLHQYTGSTNYSWSAVIAGGCDGTCYWYRSMFQYDASQTSTCLAGVG